MCLQGLLEQVFNLQIESELSIFIVRDWSAHIPHIMHVRALWAAQLQSGPKADLSFLVVLSYVLS